MKKLKNLKSIEGMLELQREKDKKNGLKIIEGGISFTIYLKGRDKSLKTRILEYSRDNLLNGGIYNEKRNCYYPKETTNKDIAEKNKLEKLFKKWGFSNL